MQRGCGSASLHIMHRAIIIGCGYVGERVAGAERDRGREVLAVSRNPERIQLLREAGVEALAADLDQPSSLPELPLAGAIVYYFAPPPPTGREDPRLGAFLGRLDARHTPEVLVLISTTGVYGDCGGDWVDESRPPAPVAERARRRWHAEQQLTAKAQALSMRHVVLRVPGIYGPGRLPRARLQRGEPVLAEAAAPWSNRVHVDDLVRACLAAAARADACGVYNVTDGHPTTMTDYFNRAADALGLARPPQIDPHTAASELSAGMLSYLAESKRIDNRRMRTGLGVTPRYEDLDEGLAASVAAERAGSRAAP